MRTLLIATLALLSLTQTGQTREAPYTEIIAFCDSLSDVGNVAGITRPGAPPLVDGYYEETHYSNDIIWIEYLADFWGLPAPTPGRGDTTSLTPQPDGTSWAWGSAEAAPSTVKPPSVTEPLPNIELQVQQYLLNNEPDPDALFVIWCGANNLLFGGEFGLRAAERAVRSVVRGIRHLESAGARSFLIVNMPRLGDTPAAQSGGPFDALAANFYSNAYNGFLDLQLAILRYDLRFDADLYLVNAYAELALIVDTVKSGETYRPRFFVPGPPVEIDDVTDRALDVFDNTGSFPTDYLFFDSVHPTTQGHQIVAGKMLQALPSEGEVRRLSR